MQGNPSLDMYEALRQTNLGHNARALPFAEAAMAAAPNNQFVAGALSRALFFLNEFERVIEIPVTAPIFKVLALVRLGRHEEATIAARRWFEASGQPLALLIALVYAGRYEAAVEFMEQRWPDLEAFQRDVPAEVGFGYPQMTLLAKAFLETDRLDRFSQAMRIAREEHDRQAEQGIGWQLFFLWDAHYWILANDQQKAIKQLEKAVDMNLFMAPRISSLHPMLKPLEGDPRFEALQQRQLENLNRDRAEAGLPPLEPAYSL